jgi:hypothetical protein
MAFYCDVVGFARWSFGGVAGLRAVSWFNPILKKLPAVSKKASGGMVADDQKGKLGDAS